MEKINIWKTIQIGLHADNASLCDGLDAEYSNFIMSPSLKGISGMIPISMTISEVDLVRLVIKDMGLPSFASYRMFSEAASDLGLELCTAEMAIQLRKDYLDQPAVGGSRIAIPVKPFIKDSNAYIFDLSADATEMMWISGENDSEDSLFSYLDRAVFVKPRR